MKSKSSHIKNNTKQNILIYIIPVKPVVISHKWEMSVPFLIQLSLVFSFFSFPLLFLQYGHCYCLRGVVKAKHFINTLSYPLTPFSVHAV